MSIFIHQQSSPPLPLTPTNITGEVSAFSAFEHSFGFQGYTIEVNLERNKVLYEHCIWPPDDSDDHDLDCSLRHFQSAT